MEYSAKYMKLTAVCEIQSGYTARKKLEPAPHGGVPAVQLRDLEGDCDFDPAGLPLYQLSGSTDRYWARPGDILFRSRGERNTAVRVAPDAQVGAIAMLPLLVLKPHEVIDSGYLTWFINQPSSQRYFDKCARGTRLRMIPKKCLDELEIVVPDLETQRRIAEVADLARREHELMLRLAEKKMEFTNFALLEQVRKAQPHGNGAGLPGARGSHDPAG
ncbi:restriction endonuclease subunit S [Billgrantia sp. LNSP4103-1]|uniref:restriction endonuclease subunit S n=1 Tax=Billgrantia sp. LNSP4103-1 TaxID=3410266 RepID=UPI00403FA1B2